MSLRGTLMDICARTRDIAGMLMERERIGGA